MMSHANVAHYKHYPLSCAINNVNIIRRLIDAGAKINSGIVYYASAYCKNSEILDLLYINGANFNSEQSPYNGFPLAESTPLATAIINQNVTAVNRLISYGCNSEIYGYS